MNTTHNENKIWFEQNFLDGDKIQNGQMLSSEFCFEAILEIREKTIDECIEIVREENYKLEDWYSSSERPKEITHFNANQMNIKTRNEIITNLNNLKNNE